MKAAPQSKVDWEHVADIVLEVILTVKKSPTDFQSLADELGGTIESVTAAAITQLISEIVEGEQPEMPSKSKLRMPKL